MIFLAPEVMCRQPHTFAVDYFALGVLAYEFMLGKVQNKSFILDYNLNLIKKRPYLGRSRKEIRD